MNIIKQATRLAVCLTVLLVVSGCTQEGRAPATEAREMRTTCLEGITYYLFKENAGYKGWGFMSAKFNRDGSINTCDN